MVATHPRPARSVAPGRILRQELEARGWSTEELAAVMNRPVAHVIGLLNGEQPLSQETAAELGKALGTSPDFWRDLESAYRLHSAASNVE
jgi:addiction module HigA family antidote